MVLLCLGLVIVAMGISLPLSGWLIGMGHKLGQVDRPDAPGGRKNHGRVVPNTGGIGIFLGIAGPLAAGLIAVHALPEAQWTGLLAPVAEHIPGLKAQTPLAVAVLLGLLVLHILGLIDDRKRLGPFSKLFVQLAVAFGLAGLADIRILHVLEQWGPAGTALSIALSVLWMVTITNAMNFLDNMDGLSGGVGAIAAALYLAATLIHGQWFVAALAALLLGALLGFLFFNFPPARIFMGDGGSLVLGMTLSIVSIRTTYFDAGQEATSGQWHALLMPVLVLAVPLYDLTSVSLIRISQGRSPFQADRQHFSHRLVAKGLKPPVAVLVIWLCTLATGLGGVIVGSLRPWEAAIVAAQAAAIIAVLALLERTAKSSGL